MENNGNPIEKSWKEATLLPPNTHIYDSALSLSGTWMKFKMTINTNKPSLPKLSVHVFYSIMLYSLTCSVKPV
jgi:hypothetical protein